MLSWTLLTSWHGVMCVHPLLTCDLANALRSFLLLRLASGTSWNPHPQSTGHSISHEGAVIPLELLCAHPADRNAEPAKRANKMVDIVIEQLERLRLAA